MTPDSPDTLAILAAVKEEKPEAVDALLARHREALRRMVALRLDRAMAARVDASDVVQEVLIEANRRLKEYVSNPCMPFGLWLRQIAHDRIIDAHRRHRVAARRSVDKEQRLAPPGLAGQSSIALAAQLVDPEHTPASAVMRQELQRHLEAAVCNLPDDDREMILMRHYEQLGNQEVAQLLGLSEAAASMRYLRALRKLKSAMGLSS